MLQLDSSYFQLNHQIHQLIKLFWGFFYCWKVLAINVKLWGKQAGSICCIALYQQPIIAKVCMTN